jgi:menaquinone reductase, iron-sulfur cluster-binding subunit
MMMKKKWGMAIDLDKCTGCGNCALACAQENNMPILDDDSDIKKRVSFLDLMKITNDRDAKYPDVKTFYLPKMCQQCEGNDQANPKPPCVSVCPVVATDVGDDGIVSQIWSRCIGCRYCQAACPYDARSFNWYSPKYRSSFKKSLNADVSIASRGTVVKCQFCSHIWKKERDKAAVKGNKNINSVTYMPACVGSCPVKAMTFGDLNDPDSELSILLKEEKNRCFRLVHPVDQKDAKTSAKLRSIKNFPNPKVYYLTANKWISDMLRFK